MEWNTWTIVGIVVAVLAIGALATWSLERRRRRRARTTDLHEKFGPEYDAVVERLGRARGERELEARTERFGALDLDRVSPDVRRDLTDRWREIQYRFVDDPEFSVREAEHLVEGLMRERGYPTAGFPTRVSALSVGYSELAARYRSAYATFRSAEDGDASVSALFDAMRSYRDLFEALLDRPDREPPASEAAAPSSEPDRAAPAGRVG
jgi:hypothetical protein